MRDEYALRKETEAAKALLAALADDLDDAELRADAVEGETGLMEAIDAALLQIDEADLMLAGLADHIRKMQERKAAMAARRDRLRALIEQAMAVCDLSGPLRRPTATLSLGKVAPALVIDSEADIPAAFFVPQAPPPPALDKAALKKALLESAQPIPGAHVDNGGVSLRIRRI